MNKYLARLDAVRARMNKAGVDALIVAQEPGRDTRRVSAMTFLCGLQSSAGYVVITQKTAHVLIDGRYSVQAREQIDETVFTIGLYTTTPPEECARDHMPDGGAVGIDGWRQTVRDYTRITDKGIKVTCLDRCLIDDLPDRRAESETAPDKAINHDLMYAGESTADKLARIMAVCDGPTLIAAPDSLAWLLNMRVPSNSERPGINGFAVADPNMQTLDVFTDTDCGAFPPLNAVRFHPRAAVTDYLDRSPALAVPDDAPALFATISEKRCGNDPCVNLKACKNPVEQACIRAAHIRDARAVWRVIETVRSSPGLTEKDVDSLLRTERERDPLCYGPSFSPIVGWNANGAKIHGTPSDKRIEGDGLLLMDSGGQYADGTTDITRTIAVGTPSPFMREKYTRVLKAHITLATAIFPEGTTGKQLDAVVRASLWKAGFDYPHGTGHGVGFCLHVHEGPANLSPRCAEPLREWMLLSNEPGYYKDGAFGIRLENLMLVQKHKDACDPDNETGKTLLCFETVTFVPFDADCIDETLLTPEELGWLESYHARCAEILS